MLVSSLAIFAGFIFLTFGADRFVIGASGIARNMGVSPLIIGLTIVGFATSAPEMMVSALAAWNNNPGLAVGNALGSNITNIALVLGITAIVTPMMVASKTLKREYPMMFLFLLLALLLLSDNYLGFVDGVILLFALVIMLGLMVHFALLDKKKQPDDPLLTEVEAEIPPAISNLKAILWLIVGLAILIASSRLLIWGAVNIAQAFGVSDLVIGLTIVALGTSLPELAASVISALKNEHEIALGNVLGSNMFNILAVLGIPGIIQPHHIDAAVLTRDFPIMLGLSMLLFIFAYGFKGSVGKINRFEGILLLTVYIAYMYLLYYQSTH